MFITCVADCCDGSDEADGVCENTCDATAKAAADARRIAQEVFDAGRVIREQWVRDAASVSDCVHYHWHD